MRGVFICPDATLARVVPRDAFGEPVLHVVATAAARRRICRRGGRAVAGDLEGESVYRRALVTGHDAVVVAVPADRAPRVLGAIRGVAPTAAVVLLPDPLDSGLEAPGITTVPPSAFVDEVIAPTIERAALRARVERARRHLAPAERVLIMMQDDPDPDAFLQIEGVEWSVVSGVVDGDLHVSLRNVGYVRAAGDVVRQAFATLGSAGGHRSMAKAVIPLRDWRQRVGEPTDEALADEIMSRLLQALRQRSKPAAPHPPRP